MLKTIIVICALLVFSVNGNTLELFDGWESVTVKIKTGDTVGTGFFMYYKRPSDSMYTHSFLVTNKHVIKPSESKALLKPTNSYREEFKKENPKIANIIDTITALEFTLGKENRYFEHPKYDIAIIEFYKHDFLRFSQKVLMSDNFIDEPVKPGQNIFFLGYPANMAGEDLTVPLVRSGIIAGIYSYKIIIDGNVFGGSSGSPIFLCKNNENGQFSYKTIGIISSSRQMKTSENESYMENIGIGIGIKSSYIIETIEMYLSNKSNKDN